MVAVPPHTRGSPPHTHTHIHTHREALARGESVVIDATNAGGDVRRQWLATAREAASAATSTSTGSCSNLRVRAVEFLAPERAVMHLNAFRGLNPHSPDPRMLPYPALKGILNRLQRVGVRACVRACCCVVCEVLELSSSCCSHPQSQQHTGRRGLRCRGASAGTRPRPVPAFAGAPPLLLVADQVMHGWTDAWMAGWMDGWERRRLASCCT